jgi:hypothetical protein
VKSGVQGAGTQLPDVVECGPLPATHCHSTVWPSGIVETKPCSTVSQKFMPVPWPIAFVPTSTTRFGFGVAVRVTVGVQRQRGRERRPSAGPA